MLEKKTKTSIEPREYLVKTLDIFNFFFRNMKELK